MQIAGLQFCQSNKKLKDIAVPVWRCKSGKQKNQNQAKSAQNDLQPERFLLFGLLHDVPPRFQYSQNDFFSGTDCKYACNFSFTISSARTAARFSAIS